MEARTKEELVNLKEYLFIEYLDKRRHIDSISEELGIKVPTLFYHIRNTGHTQSSYLLIKYPKEFIEKKLELYTFKQLAKELNITISEFRVLAKKHGIKRDTSIFYKKNVVNSDFYNSVKFEKEFYYFAGLFATDGCFAGKNQIKISIKNKGAEKVLTQIANCAGHNNINSFKNDYYCLSFSDINLKQKLIDIGIPEHQKTYNLKDIYIPNNNCLWSFLNGALDGDGHVGSSISPFGYRTTLHYGLCNYNVEFLKVIELKIKNMLGFECTVSIPNKPKDIPSLYLGSRQGSKEFFKTMYEISPFSLECKKQRYLDIINKKQINEE